VERRRRLARTAAVLAIVLPLADGLGLGIPADPAGAVQATPRGGAGVAPPPRARSATDAGQRAPSPLAATVDGQPTPSSRRDERATPHVLVHVERSAPLTARPGSGPVVGTMPRGSRYFGTPMVAWALEISQDGRFARVPIPYAGRRATGWLRIRGLETSTTRVAVIADLSEHRIEVRRGDRVLFRAAAATGASGSPTPPGRYFVTDRVPFPGGGVYGTFAFGISGIQTRLPAGWTGGDQLAVHGTDRPATIGRSASAGCLRVSERVLRRLRPLLRLGTPVVIRP
jgi:lipoprotein-anchoring transpeptidase ErfK/SrfK